MSLYKRYKSDEDLEREGVWLEYGETDDGRPIRFRVSRAGPTNVRYAKALESKLKPYRRQIASESMDEKVAERIYREVFVDTVLLGWENVENEDGHKMEFARANALKLMTDLPDLYSDLREMSTRAAIFRQVTLEADAGN